MSLQTNLKSQMNSLSSKVTKAEKVAAKQIRQILKSTERIRGQQLKHIQSLIRKAEALKSTTLAKQARSVKSEVESRASAGLELLLAKLNVPSRKELERLTKKVTSLQKKIEDLEKSRSA